MWNKCSTARYYLGTCYIPPPYLLVRRSLPKRSSKSSGPPQCAFSILKSMMMAVKSAGVQRCPVCPVLPMLPLTVLPRSHAVMAKLSSHLVDRVLTILWQVPRPRSDICRYQSCRKKPVLGGMHGGTVSEPIQPRRPGINIVIEGMNIGCYFLLLHHLSMIVL